MIGCDPAPLAIGAIPGAQRATDSTRAVKRWVLTAAILGSSMGFIDSTVANIALPAMQVSLGATSESMQWVVNAYTLMLAALTLVGGAAGDAFGQRRVMATGIVVFVAASMTCGIAPDAITLCIARAVQGIGAALLMPTSLAVIGSVFDDTERGRAIGTWASAAALASALGPVVGGWLVDHASWRAIFFLNLPIGLVALVLVMRWVPAQRAKARLPALDIPGAALAALGLAGLTYGLIAANDAGWAAPHVAGSLLVGIVSIAAFLWVEARSAEPMLPLGLFRSRTFLGANLLTVALYFALSGAMFLLPFNLIGLQKYSTAEAGAAFLPFTIIMGLGSRWSGGLVAQYGPRAPLLVGSLIAAAGLALFALPGQGGSYWTTFFPAMVVLGIGMTIAVAPLTTVVMAAVAPEHTGTASGINNTAARVAGLFAVAVLGLVFLRVLDADFSRRVAMLSLPDSVKQEVMTAPTQFSGKVLPQIAGDARRLLVGANQGAFLDSFRLVMLLTAACALAGATAVTLIAPR